MTRKFLTIFIIFSNLALASESHPPNIVLISIDSLRRDRLSVYGYNRPDIAPNIGELSKKSIIFNNYYSTSYLTPVSETSVHTGLYPDRHNVDKMRDWKIKTLSTILKNNNYRTYAYGNSPEFNYYEYYRNFFIQGFDSYKISTDRLGYGVSYYRAELEKILQNTEKTKPVYLWFALGSAHAPFGYNHQNKYAEKNYNGIFTKILSFANVQYYYDGYVYDPNKKGNKFKIAKFANNLNPSDRMDFVAPETKEYIYPYKVNDKDMKYMHDMYDNGISHVDGEVGIIIDVLKKHELFENSIIIIQSEHGETLGERKYIAHSDIYDELTHVPLIVKLPNQNEGQTYDSLVSGIDILPSLLTFLKLQLPENIDGQSFIEFKNGKPKLKKRNDEFIYITRTPLWEKKLKTDEENSIFDKLRYYQSQVSEEFKDYAIRSKKYKVIHRRARLIEMQFSAWTFISGKPLDIPEYEFYDVVSDPKELKPLKPAGEEFEKLKKKLLKFENNLKNEKNSLSTVTDIQDYR